MLIKEAISFQIGAPIMSDVAIVAAAAKVTLSEISRQSHALGVGLQNAAPLQKSGSPNNSVQYLLTIAETLNKIAVECDQLYQSSLKESGS